MAPTSLMILVKYSTYNYTLEEISLVCTGHSVPSIPIISCAEGPTYLWSKGVKVIIMAKPINSILCARKKWHSKFKESTIREYIGCKKKKKR